MKSENLSDKHIQEHNDTQPEMFVFELTEELREELITKIYALFLRDLQIERERYGPDHDTGLSW